MIFYGATRSVVSAPDNVQDYKTKYKIQLKYRKWQRCSHNESMREKTVKQMISSTTGRTGTFKLLTETDHRNFNQLISKN